MEQTQIEDLNIEKLLEDLEIKMVKLWHAAIPYIFQSSPRQYIRRRKLEA